MGLDHLSKYWLTSKDTEATDSNTEKRKACDAVGPAANVFENDWVGDEAKIENTIDDANVSEYNQLIT